MKIIVKIITNIIIPTFLWVITPLLLFSNSGQAHTVYLERDYPGDLIFFIGSAIFLYLLAFISLIQKEKLYRYFLVVLFFLEFLLISTKDLKFTVQGILAPLIPIAFSLLVHISARIHLQKKPKILFLLRILYSCAFLLPFIVIFTDVIGPTPKVDDPITVSLSDQKLLLAAPGPGFPQMARDLPGNTKKLNFDTWVGVIGTKKAEDACAMLSQSGKRLENQPLNYWRLPTADEQVALLGNSLLKWPNFFTFYFTSSNQTNVSDIRLCDKDRDGKCIYVVRKSDRKLIPEFTSMWHFGYRCVHSLERS